MKELQQYTYTIPAGGSVQIPASNDNFIVQASTGPLAVRGNTFGRLRGLVAGQGLKSVPFDRLELFDESGAPNTVTLLMTPAEFVNQTFSGSVVIVGAQALDMATINALRRPESSTGYFINRAAIGANSPLPAVLPGANVNGLVLLSAQIGANGGGAFDVALLAKATAPANVPDGETILMAEPVQRGGTDWASSARLSEKQFIPAGLGLYFIASTNMPATDGNFQTLRYRLL